ncbi:hypothetical protein E2562_038846, partial [Oryza meyeriana var. granulata]
PQNDDKDGGPAAFPGREATAEVEGAATEPMVKAMRLDGDGRDCEWQPGLARTAESSDSWGRRHPSGLRLQGMAAEYLPDAVEAVVGSRRVATGARGMVELSGAWQGTAKPGGDQQIGGRTEDRRRCVDDDADVQGEGERKWRRRLRWRTPR